MDRDRFNPMLVQGDKIAAAHPSWPGAIPERGLYRA
jgi:hypothetical protein